MKLGGRSRYTSVVVNERYLPWSTCGVIIEDESVDAIKLPRPSAGLIDVG